MARIRGYSFSMGPEPLPTRPLERVEGLRIVVDDLLHCTLRDVPPICSVLQRDDEAMVLGGVFMTVIRPDEQVVLTDVLEEQGEVLVHLTRHVDPVGRE